LPWWWSNPPEELAKAIVENPAEAGNAILIVVHNLHTVIVECDCEFYYSFTTPPP